MLDRFSHCKALVHMMLLYIAHLCQQHAGFFSSSKTLTPPFHRACTASRVSGTMMPLSQSLCKFLHQLLQQTLPLQLTQLPVHYLDPALLATTETESAGLRLPAACGQRLLKCGHQTRVLLMWARTLAKSESGMSQQPHTHGWFRALMSAHTAEADESTSINI